MNPSDVEALARATLAHGLIQLTLHFPVELGEVGLTPSEALRQALRLAEEAIALAPHLPDGHTALGRLILCSNAPEALDDALEVLRHALGLDAEHDPADVGVATALWSSGDSAAALSTIDRVLKRGNALPQPLMLRGLLHMEAGRHQDARRDFERAVLLAPQAGVFRLDAADAADAAGDSEAAKDHRAAARDLLGSAYDDLARARHSQRD